MALCTISGTFLDAQGNGIDSAPITFTVESPSLDVSGHAITPRQFSTTTAADGTWSLDILQSTTGTLTLLAALNNASPDIAYQFSLVIPATSTALFSACWVDAPNYAGTATNLPLTFAMISGQLSSAQLPDPAEFSGDVTIDGNLGVGMDPTSGDALDVAGGVRSVRTDNSKITLQNTATASTWQLINRSGDASFEENSVARAIFVSGGGIMRIPGRSLVGGSTLTPYNLGTSLAAVNISAGNTIASVGYGGSGAVRGYSSRGTESAPTASQSGDLLALFGGHGYGATAFSSGNRGNISIVAAENWTDAAQGTHATVSTTAVGAANPTEKVRVTSAGRVGIGTSSPSTTLDVSGTANVSSDATVGGTLVVTGTVSASNFSGTSSGTNTGDVTLAAVGSTPSANGASLSSQVLTLQPADATHPGVVTTGSQTLAGTKTFSSTISGSINGNAATVTTNANLTGPITSSGNATAIASQTGTGTTFVMDTSPVLVTPNLGTPSACVGTNITGTASSLTAGHVTTNANLTGDVTSVGNATSIAAGVVTNTMLAGSIAASKLVGTDIATVGTLTAGTASTGFTVALNSATITGTLSDARLPSSMATKTFTGTTTFPGTSSIDGSGNAVFGGTISSGSKLTASRASGVACSVNLTDTTSGSDSSPSLQVNKYSTTNTAGTNHFIDFTLNSTGTASGYIGTNGASAAAFFSSSDRRLKTNIAPLENALDTVLSLNPVTYSWKSDGSTATGFIAQELAEVLPQSVHKTDDGAGDALPEGQQAWSMTESGMVPYLVKAIQELKAEFDAYKASHP